MGFLSFDIKAGDSATVSTGFVRSYSINYVITTDTVMTVWQVGSHPNLPKVMIDKHPEDSLAWCTSLSPTQRSNNPLIWDVVAQFSYALDGGGGGIGGGYTTGNPLIDGQNSGKPPAERVEDPLARPNDYTYRTQVVRNEDVWHDTVRTEKKADGTEFTPPKPWMWRNTAGDPISEPFMRPVYGLGITIGMNMPGAPDTSWDNLCGKLNADPCTIGTRIFLRRSVMMMGYSCHPVYERGVSYWRWEVDVLHRPDFYHVIWSKGLNAYFDKHGKKEKLPIASGSKNKLSGPQILNEKGYCADSPPAGEEWHPYQLILDCYEVGSFPTRM
jgi:hypothetical protein